MTRAERSGGRNRPATGKTEPKGPEVTGGFLDSTPREVVWYRRSPRTDYLVI